MKKANLSVMGRLAFMVISNNPQSISPRSSFINSYIESLISRSIYGVIFFGFFQACNNQQLGS